MNAAGSVLSGEALAAKHKEQNVLFQSCLADDPNFAKQVRSLDLMLRVRDRLSGSSLPGSPGDSCSNKFSNDDKVKSASLPDRGTSGAEGNSAVAWCPRGGRSAGCFESFSEDTECASGSIAVGVKGVPSALGVQGGFQGSRTVLDSSGEKKGITGMPEGIESDFSKNCAVDLGTAEKLATAGESEEILGLHVSPSSLHNSSNSRGCVAAVACARLLAVPGVSARVCPVSSSSAVSAAVAHARFTPMHDAHNSGGTGGLLPVQRSTSYFLGNSWSDTGRVTGPTERRCTKGGVSGPAEDLRPVSEVEAGVNFRLAGRIGKGSVVTPSLHPEVPDSLSVSPGPGKRIRQLMGWTKVCETAQSGIWVLQGNTRTCMFPANLDHLRVEWRKQGSYKTAWVTPGHDCLCSYKYGHGAAVRPQPNKAIWDGVISLWCRVAPFLSPWCGKKELPTGVNLNHYDGSRSCVRWHSDNESLFGPRDSPKLIVSLSLGNPVEFKVRRVSDGVTSSITLDHGDVLVMDGSAQLEYLHCTMPGLQGPRVNLIYRWVAQHTASCPHAGVVGCLLPSCVQGLAEPGSRLWEKGENNWFFSWELAFLLFILMSVLLVSIWMNIRKECCNSGQRPSCSLVHFPSRGRARWVGGRRWPLSRRSQLSKKRTFYFPWVFLWVAKLCLFSTRYGFLFWSYCWVC